MFLTFTFSAQTCLFKGWRHRGSHQLEVIRINKSKPFSKWSRCMFHTQLHYIWASFLVSYMHFCGGCWAKMQLHEGRLSSRSEFAEFKTLPSTFNSTLAGAALYSFLANLIFFKRFRPLLSLESDAQQIWLFKAVLAFSISHLYILPSSHRRLQSLFCNMRPKKLATL